MPKIANKKKNLLKGGKSNSLSSTNPTELQTSAKPMSFYNKLKQKSKNYTTSAKKLIKHTTPANPTSSQAVNPTSSQAVNPTAKPMSFYNKLKKKSKNYATSAKKLIKHTTPANPTSSSGSILNSTQINNLNKILKSNKITNLSQLQFITQYYSSQIQPPYSYIDNILKLKVIIINSVSSNSTFNSELKNINIILDNNILIFLEKYIGDWSSSYITFLSQQAGSKSLTSMFKSILPSSKKSSQQKQNNYIQQINSGISKQIIYLEIIEKYTNNMVGPLNNCYINNIGYYEKIGYSQIQMNTIKNIQCYVKVCQFLADTTRLDMKVDQEGNIQYNTVSQFINNLNNRYKRTDITPQMVTGFENISQFVGC